MSNVSKFRPWIIEDAPCAALSHNGQLMATASDLCNVARIWSLVKRKIVSTLDLGPGCCTCFSHFPHSLWCTQNVRQAKFAWSVDDKLLAWARTNGIYTFALTNIGGSSGGVQATQIGFIALRTNNVRTQQIHWQPSGIIRIFDNANSNINSRSLSGVSIVRQFTPAGHQQGAAVTGWTALNKREYSPDGTLWCCFSHRENVLIGKEGDHLSHVVGQITLGYGGNLTSAAISPDNTLVGVIIDNQLRFYWPGQDATQQKKTFQVWSLTPEVRCVFECADTYDAQCESFKWSPCSKYFALLNDGKIQIWSASTFTLLHNIRTVIIPQSKLSLLGWSAHNVVTAASHHDAAAGATEQVQVWYNGTLWSDRIHHTFRDMYFRAEVFNIMCCCVIHDSLAALLPIELWLLTITFMAR